jgi:hypothetical protein
MYNLFNKDINDFSLLYFTNQMLLFKTTLATSSAGLGNTTF